MINHQLNYQFNYKKSREFCGKSYKFLSEMQFVCNYFYFVIMGIIKMESEYEPCIPT